MCRGVADGQGGRRFAKVALKPEAAARLAAVREYIESHWLEADAPVVYGFNTGVGPLKNLRISPEDNDRFQRNLMISHAADIGDPAPEEVLRPHAHPAQLLAKGVSGCGPRCGGLIARLNHVHP